MPSRRRISVYFADPALANALRERLAAATDETVEVVDDVVSQLGQLGTLVTSTTQCSPAECAGIAEAGGQVIVLAAVPSDFQKQLYESAGAAAYLPMALDLAPLVAAIARVETSAA
jgi:hypothetical protein